MMVINENVVVNHETRAQGEKSMKLLVEVAFHMGETPQSPRSSLKVDSYLMCINTKVLYLLFILGT